MKRKEKKATVGWLLLSAVVAAVLLVRVGTRPLADSLLELRVVNGASLEDLEPGTQYITHPTRGLIYSAGQLPFDVSELPNSKSICDWVYCPSSSEAIQVHKWSPAEEYIGKSDPFITRENGTTRALNDYGVTWAGWDYSTYGDVTNTYEPPDCIVKHLGPREKPPEPCAVPGRSKPEDFSASRSTQHGMYAGPPLDEIDEKFGYQLPSFDANRGRRQRMRVKLARASVSPFERLLPGAV